MDAEERLRKIQHILGEYVGTTDITHGNAIAHELVPYIPWLLEQVNELQETNSNNIMCAEMQG